MVVDVSLGLFLLFWQIYELWRKLEDLAKFAFGILWEAQIPLSILPSFLHLS